MHQNLLGQIDDLDSAERAGQEFGYPLMIKSRRMAYDGRGNAVAKSEEALTSAINGIKFYQSCFGLKICMLDLSSPCLRVHKIVQLGFQGFLLVLHLLIPLLSESNLYRASYNILVTFNIQWLIIIDK